MQLKESLPEARRESRRRLGDAALGTSQFRSEARKEVILRLFRRQNRNRRQYAESVRRKEDDALRSGRCGNRLHDVLDMVDWIRNAGVFRHALVREIDFAVLVYRDVLKQRVALDRVVNVRLRLLVEIDYLRVAAALEVEHALWRRFPSAADSSSSSRTYPSSSRRRTRY